MWPKHYFIFFDIDFRLKNLLNNNNKSCTIMINIICFVRECSATLKTKNLVTFLFQNHSVEDTGNFKCIFLAFLEHEIFDYHFLASRELEEESLARHKNEGLKNLSPNLQHDLVLFSLVFVELLYSVEFLFALVSCYHQKIPAHFHSHKFGSHLVNNSLSCLGLTGLYPLSNWWNRC